MAALRRGRVNILRRRLEIREAISEISGRLSFGSPKRTRPGSCICLHSCPRCLATTSKAWRTRTQALVFTAPRTGPLRYSNARKAIWDPSRVRAGEDLVHITPHDLRHTCASLMRAAGADVKAIQQQLGHRNATVTLNTYTHLFEGDLDKVMDRLDSYYATSSRPERVLSRITDISNNTQP